MGELSQLPNIGKELERQLTAVGVTTREELVALGSRAAWLKLQQNDPSACMHRLQALEGAICGVRKSELPTAVKAELKAFYTQHKLPSSKA